MKSALAATLLATIAALLAGCGGPTAMDFNEMGLQHFAAQEYDSAQSAFYQATAMEPTNGDFYFNLGAAQQARGRLDDALGSYRTAIRLSPGLIDAHQNIALCYLAKNETAAAERAYENMCKLNPVSARPFLIVADYWQQRGDRFRTREYLSKAVGANPKDAEARFRFYQFLQKEGDTQQAAVHYRSYLELKAIADAQAAAGNNQSANVSPSRNISGSGVR